MDKLLTSGRVLITLLFSIATSQVVIEEAFPNLVFTQPVDLQYAPDGSDRLFVVEQEGSISVFENDALDILKQKKNRIILKHKPDTLPQKQVRTILNGILEQDKDLKVDTIIDMKVVTEKQPTEAEMADLEFANKIVKHTKSNAIVLAKDQMLCASGTGQTSRVDALKQAIEKAKNFEKELSGAVMASDAFFPFPDCVEIAHDAGVTAVIQPGGSIKDQDSINVCNENNMSMVLTGTRHFRH